MKLFLLLSLVSFKIFAQGQIVDAQNLLGKIDAMVKVKDGNKLFPCNSHTTYGRHLDQMTYTCTPTNCEIGVWTLHTPAWEQEQVLECTETSRAVIKTNGEYYEASDEYLASINYNLVRHFIAYKLPLLFPENGKLVIKEMKTAKFVQYRDFPFRRELPATQLLMTYYPVEGMYGLDVNIKFNLDMPGMNQILEVTQGEDLWFDYMF